MTRYAKTKAPRGTSPAGSFDTVGLTAPTARYSTEREKRLIVGGGVVNRGQGLAICSRTWYAASICATQSGAGHGIPGASHPGSGQGRSRCASQTHPSTHTEQSGRRNAASSSIFMALPTWQLQSAAKGRASLYYDATYGCASVASRMNPLALYWTLTGPDGPSPLLPVRHGNRPRSPRRKRWRASARDGPQRVRCREHRRCMEGAIPGEGVGYDRVPLGVSHGRVPSLQDRS
jgi:hypothetical protein